MSDSVWPHRRQPTRLPRPWESPGKNTGVGCHFLLQCIKVKSESEVAQSCPTLRDPMDCSLPGSSIHGIFQARVLEWDAIAFSGRPGVLQFMGSQRVRHNWATELNWTELKLVLAGRHCYYYHRCSHIRIILIFWNLEYIFLKCFFLWIAFISILDSISTGKIEDLHSVASGFWLFLH